MGLERYVFFFIFHKNFLPKKKKKGEAKNRFAQKKFFHEAKFDFREIFFFFKTFTFNFYTAVALYLKIYFFFT